MLEAFFSMEVGKWFIFAQVFVIVLFIYRVFWCQNYEYTPLMVTIFIGVIGLNGYYWAGYIAYKLYEYCF